MLVLIGILGAVAVPRLMVGSQFEERLQADKLVGLLRQAQLRAMNDPVSVTENDNLSRCAKVFISKEGFSIAQGCKSGLLDPEMIKQQANQGIFVGASGVSITANSELPLTVQFGKPAVDAKFLSEDSLLGRPFINGVRKGLVISIAGKAVHIEPEGYIHGP